MKAKEKAVKYNFAFKVFDKYNISFSHLILWGTIDVLNHFFNINCL